MSSSVSTRDRLVWRLVRIGTPVERSYLDERKAATLVRKQYGRAGTKPVKISRAHQRELSAEERDPKTLQSVEAYFADFGKEEPWARFYAALQTGG